MKELRENNKCIEPGSIVGYSHLISGLQGKYMDLSGRICIKSLVPLAINALERGGDPYRVASFLDWKDFEEFVKTYFNLSNYNVISNVRFTKRRLEVDVLAVDPVSHLGIIVDCKHWAPGYSKASKLRKVCLEHRRKVELLTKECSFIISKYPIIRKAESFIPVIVTLTDTFRGYVNDSFIVPIGTFRDFISNLRYYLELLAGEHGIVRNPCYIS
jgi:hypothetical protein